MKNFLGCSVDFLAFINIVELRCFCICGTVYFGLESWVPEFHLLDLRYSN